MGAALRSRVPVLRRAVSAAALLTVLSAGATEFVRTAGACWQDGFFLGDGGHGVVAFAPQQLEWFVNRNTVYNPFPGECVRVPHRDVIARIESGREKDVKFLFDEDRIVRERGPQATVTPLQLRLRFWPEMAWSAPSMPLVTGTLSTDVGKLTERAVGGGRDRTVETVAVREHDAVAFRLTKQDAHDAPSVFTFARPANRLLPGSPRWTEGDGILSFEQDLPEGGRFAVAVAWTASGDIRVREVGDARELWLSAGTGELFVAIRSRREAEDPLAAAQAARERGFAALARTNEAWWRGFWSRGGRAHFDSEPEIGRLWDLSLFTLASTFGRSPMPGLNGLSFGPYDAVFAGLSVQGYTHDQNAQIPFFPLFPLNHCELVRALTRTYADILPRLRRDTRDYYGAEGVCLPLVMNQDGAEIPTRGYRYTLCGSAYTGLVLSMAWRHSRDRTLLEEELYPLLREFCLYHLSQMTPGEDGRYHHTWGVPPEIFTMTRDDAATLAMLRVDLETLVETSELLGRDADLRARCRTVLAHWPGQSYRPDGAFWAGPDIPFDHYHYGAHLLYPFFPSGSLTDAAARRAALKTVDYAKERGWDWERDVREIGPYAKHEWSAYLTGMTRMRAGTDGWTALKEYVKWFGKPNGLFSHNAVIVDARASGSAEVTPNPAAKALVAPVVESSAAFLHLATEALFQSWGGEVRLFPGVPKDFTGSFENFLTEDGRKVSARMENGRIREVEK